MHGFSITWTSSMWTTTVDTVMSLDASSNYYLVYLFGFKAVLVIVTIIPLFLFACSMSCILVCGSNSASNNPEALIYDEMWRWCFVVVVWYLNKQVQFEFLKNTLYNYPLYVCSFFFSSTSGVTDAMIGVNIWSSVSHHTFK